MLPAHRGENSSATCRAAQNNDRMQDERDMSTATHEGVRTQLPRRASSSSARTQPLAERLNLAEGALDMHEDTLEGGFRPGDGPGLLRR
ncbi:hypothetical protein SAMN03080610_01312 [Afifella marina DSM 2698]|uniref:Uncharacterized protein n=1 Tax=Afifella marina DSM 2698 TaxID=1120955 RepID=A0A1G5N210_AFIMA|nr:hypothetical protein SAMN03080610_01312 [Afifella marina DSM 2698]